MVDWLVIQRWLVKIGTVPDWMTMIQKQASSIAQVRYKMESFCDLFQPGGTLLLSLLTDLFSLLTNAPLLEAKPSCSILLLLQ